MSELKIKNGDGTDKYLASFGTGETGDAYHNIPALFELEVAKSNVIGHSLNQGSGKNPNVDIGTTPEDVWNGGGIYTGFPTGVGETMEIYSSSANDTAAGTGARTVKIMNLIDDTGASMPDITVTLNGTSQVSLGAGVYYRGGTKMMVLTGGSSGANEGELTLRHTTTTANIFAVMPIGANMTTIMAYTVPLGKTLYINRAIASMGRASGAAGSAEISIRSRLHGTDAVFNALVSPQITEAHGYSWENNGWLVFEERTDVKLTVDSVSDNSTIVSGDWGGVLISN